MVNSVYIAAPIVGVSEDVKSKINKVIETIHETFPDAEIYDPSKHKVPNEWGMSIEEWARSIFALDVVAIDSCEWVVVCDYGRGGTAGTGWECGYAFGKGKKILVVHMKDDADYSVMIEGSSSNHCSFSEFCFGLDGVKKYFTLRGKSCESNIVYN